jgi:DNA-binding cell septation regulator SpoVG
MKKIINNEGVKMKVEKVFFTKYVKDNLLGFGSVILKDSEGDSITIKDMRLMKNKSSGEFFVSFPSKKGQDKDGTEKWYDLAFTSKDLRDKLTSAFESAYNNSLRDGGSSNSGSSYKKAKPQDDEDDLPF